jgi:hypothetical protein
MRTENKVNTEAKECWAGKVTDEMPLRPEVCFAIPSCLVIIFDGKRSVSFHADLAKATE